MNFHLPCFDSDTSESILDSNISNSDVSNTGFGIIFAETSNADSMTRSTIHIMNIYFGTTSLYRYAIIACKIKLISILDQNEIKCFYSYLS